MSQKIVEGCENLAEHTPISELEAERDDLLIKMLAIFEESKLWHIGNKEARAAQEARWNSKE